MKWNLICHSYGFVTLPFFRLSSSHCAVHPQAKASEEIKKIPSNLSFCKHKLFNHPCTVRSKCWVSIYGNWFTNFFSSFLASTSEELRGLKLLTLDSFFFFFWGEKIAIILFNWVENTRVDLFSFLVGNDGNFFD